MKTKYRYIHFEKIEGEWFCYNNISQNELGRICYSRIWGLYVIEFELGCVFNNTCLTDIAHFLKQLQGGKSIPKHQSKVLAKAKKVRE